MSTRDLDLQDERLGCLGEALASYQAEYGDVTEEEMASRVRRDREGARGGCPPLK